MTEAVSAQARAAVPVSSKARVQARGVGAALADVHHGANDFNTVLYSNLALARACGVGKSAEQSCQLAIQLADRAAAAHRLADDVGRALTRSPGDIDPAADALDGGLVAVFNAAGDLQAVFADVRVCPLASAIDRRLKKDLSRARRRALDLHAALEIAGLGIRPSAGRIVAVAARLLPESDRARYTEEFLCELWELAREGASARQQRHYAMEQLARVMSLRGALPRPHRDEAAP